MPPQGFEVGKEGVGVITQGCTLECPYDMPIYDCAETLWAKGVAGSIPRPTSFDLVQAWVEGEWLKDVFAPQGHTVIPSRTQRR